MDAKNFSIPILDRIFIEALFVIGVNLVLFTVFAHYDTLEWVYHFSRAHEDWELDEIVPIFFTLSVSLLVFSVRRWLETRALLAEVSQLSIRDSLTGLFNKQYIMNEFAKEDQRFKRSQIKYSVVLVDIDNFKTINERFGEKAGDVVIRQFTSIFMSLLRVNDVVARWSGEEFIILCPDTELTGASKLAEKLKTAILDFDFDSVGNITASFGVTMASVKDEFNETINRADICLYKAKQRGKNCIVAV